MFKLNLSRRRKFNILLLGVAILISGFFIFFTNYLVGELSKEEIEKVKKVADAYEALNDPNTTDVTPAFQIIQNTTIPIIVTDKNELVSQTKNLDPVKSKNPAYVKELIKKWKYFNKPIKVNEYQFIYFEEKPAVTLLRFYPYLQFLLLAVFLAIAYIAITSSRRFEQNRVWVGMAKETAHQIGTPLSSLMAWVDYLKAGEGYASPEVIDELEKDVNRLNIIAERFSKIGSTPELVEYNLYNLLEESIDYLRARIPKKVNITIHGDGDYKNVNIKINKNLFSWVIENLTKNAADAMEGDGDIRFIIRPHKDFVLIDIKDSGKGILRSNYKNVFEPGFTTKKRCWGLGLSLTKRIIENYHKGEIFVKDSEQGKGTTFRIRLGRA
ncbi:MAG: HAMP domain-containing sensor histidine kinase [Bacteroidetes bacterium]|nr:HAMP domain-containing sensor histidine kinase [Bacteroidota bacterium]